MQITSKELRVKTKTALDAVRRGEEVEITFHGKVVALLVNPDDFPDQEKNQQSVSEDLPGFGMWADRDDIEETSKYVRSLRKPRYKL